MIERGARVLCEAKLWPGAWEKETEGNREEWRMLSRAMLRSMREPTDAMIECPMARCYNDGPYAAQEVRRIFSSMIDAALERGK